ncbi:hypothetical protein D3C78_1858100 [compost metagenome]
MARHKLFREIFTTFQNGTFFFRTYYGDFRQLIIIDKEIMDSIYKRLFRANNYQFYVFFKDKRFYSIEVIGINVYVFTISICAAITWCDKQL